MASKLIANTEPRVQQLSDKSWLERAMGPQGQLARGSEFLGLCGQLDFRGRCVIHVVGGQTGRSAKVETKQHNYGIIFRTTLLRRIHSRDCGIDQTGVAQTADAGQGAPVVRRGVRPSLHHRRVNQCIAKSGADATSEHCGATDTSGTSARSRSFFDAERGAHPTGGGTDSRKNDSNTSTETDSCADTNHGTCNPARSCVSSSATANRARRVGQRIEVNTDLHCQRQLADEVEL